MLARLDYRAGLIEAALKEAGFTPRGQSAECPWAAVAGRGGLLPPMECGTYLVDDAMVEELRLARRGEHASNLGALLALRFAHAAGVNAYIVDPVTVDEWQPCARLSGSPLVERTARRPCAEHQGRGAALCARARQALRGAAADRGAHGQRHHRLGAPGGRMIDSNSIEEGPFGPDRTGGLPVRELIKLCFSGRFTQPELDRHVFGDGGLFAYLGTRDLIGSGETDRRRRPAGRGGLRGHGLPDRQRGRSDGGGA